MKSARTGGLRALNGRSTASIHRSKLRRVMHVFAGFLRRVFGTQAVAIARQIIAPIAVLIVLAAACIVLPPHRFVAGAGDISHFGVSRIQPTDVSFAVHVPAFGGAKHALHVTLPAVRHRGGAAGVAFWSIVDATALILGIWYWLRCFRSGGDDRRYRRFVLRLLLTAPAITGLMAASIVAGSDWGGHAVAATLATSAVIASSLLVATVVGRSASTLVLASLAGGMGLMDIFPAWATVAAIAGALAGQYSARNVRDRSAVVRCAALTMAGAAISAFVASLVTGHQFSVSASLGMQALLTGCLGAALWFTLLTVLERPLELTTPLGLLELLDPTKPILERFAREAPGTFAHSVFVGHLAAAAAEAVGADPLLCRVAAQYHDLGKMRRAQFFRENQVEGDENVHDRMAPSLSAIVVNSHVRDGEQMARELRLPPVIQDIITQHHGTTLMQYFFHRAAAGAPIHRVEALEHQFRYSGPKPQSKEAGIMMLADAVEAASRTIGRPTRDKIRELIDRIVDDRLEDHQLDECPLTLKDISIIRDTLCDVVCAMMHQRVVYPSSCEDPQPVVEAKPNTTFDFYEDFDPAVLLEQSRQHEAERAAAIASARLASPSGKTPRHPSRRRAQRIAHR